MERLLNIKEAAELLNVSEITLRRWTNAGTLRCYRVGGRRERRFRARDLETFLESGSVPSGPPPVSLGFQGLVVPEGSHLAHLCLDAGESLEAGASYLFEGLSNGETAIVVSTEEAARNLLSALRERYADVETFIGSGRLRLRRGEKTPERQAASMERDLASAAGRIRLLGEMSWARQQGWTAQMLEQLESLTCRPHPTKGLFLCQYPLDAFSGREVMMAVEKHAYIVYAGGVRESPYFQRTG